jgi:G3E family GTPase
MQGQLNVTWLDMPRHPKRQASFPNAHKITKLSSAENSDRELSNETDGYQSFGHVFPAHSCFDYQQLNDFLSKLKVERIKGILNTNKSWFIINGTETTIQYIPIKRCNGQIEIIVTQHDFHTTLKKMMYCKVLDNLENPTKTGYY